MCFQPCSPCDVVLGAFGVLVNPTVNLDHQPQLRAEEVHDEAADRVLPPELEAFHLAVPNEGPHLALCTCRIAP
jgi:hypothetical protein